jgi:hypothetical protein
MAPVALHYHLLGAPAGMLLSLFYLFADLSVPVARRIGRMVWLQAALALAAAGVVALFWQGPADLLPLAGTLMVIGSRGMRRYLRLLALMLVSTLMWGGYGLLVSSYSQVGSSAIYAMTCAVGLVRRGRGVNQPVERLASHDPEGDG